HESSPVIVDNVIRSHGSAGIDTGWGRAFIAHNLIEDNWFGVNSWGKETIVNNTFSSNYVGVYTVSSISVHYNNFVGNSFGLYAEYLYWPNATLNWWGAPDGPSGSGPGSGDSVNEYVYYEPWLRKFNPLAGPRSV
ncbi:MAG: hypothetical protein J7L32_06045, partial [Thermoplasmata archaeon]|nr:hypothetical protein [Thermoplasmata archaeon]